MASDGVPTERQDLNHLVRWLDEQRREDHERLTELTRTVADIRTTIRDQGLALNHVEAAKTVRANTEVRIDVDAVGKVADQIVLLDRTVHEHIETQSRASQADAALRDRERRQFSELLLQVEALSRGVDVASGRVNALSEEIRHERESRQPITQALEDVRRNADSLASRLAAIDLTIRRVSSVQATFEQSEDKRTNDLARVDQQLKLIDLRLTRELADIRKIVDDSRTSTEESVKPVDFLKRLVDQSLKEQDAVQVRVVELATAVDNVADSLARTEAQGRSDRSAVERLADAASGLTRRIEANGASIWQLSERQNVTTDDIARIQADIRLSRELAETASRRIDKGDEDRRRLEAFGQQLESDLGVLRSESRATGTELGDRLENQVDSAQQAWQLRRRVQQDHLRRLIAELTQQLLELESSNDGPAQR